MADPGGAPPTHPPPEPPENPTSLERRIRRNRVKIEAVKAAARRNIDAGLPEWAVQELVGAAEGHFRQFLMADAAERPARGVWAWILRSVGRSEAHLQSHLDRLNEQYQGYLGGREAREASVGMFEHQGRVPDLLEGEPTEPRHAIAANVGGYPAGSQNTPVAPRRNAGVPGWGQGQEYPHASTNQHPQAAPGQHPRGAPAQHPQPLRRKRMPFGAHQYTQGEPSQAPPALATQHPPAAAGQPSPPRPPTYRSMAPSYHTRRQTVQTLPVYDQGTWNWQESDDPPEQGPTGDQAGGSQAGRSQAGRSQAGGSQAGGYQGVGYRGGGYGGGGYQGAGYQGNIDEEDGDEDDGDEDDGDEDDGRGGGYQMARGQWGGNGRGTWRH